MLHFFSRCGILYILIGVCVCGHILKKAREIWLSCILKQKFPLPELISSEAIIEKAEKYKKEG